MLVTALSSIVVGALAGIALACVIFIVEMSRPTVRRCIRGADMFSKRWRSADDLALLRRTGTRRIALELQGVLSLAMPTIWRSRSTVCCPVAT